MSASRLLTLLGVVVLAVTVGVAGWRSMGDDGNDAPAAAASTTDIDAVTAELIAFYAGRVERDPADFASYTKLGESYARQARETGDAQALMSAQTALSQALEVRSEYLPAKAALAGVRLSSHDFEGAIALAREVYEADAAATAALATIGDAQVALGQYAEARVTYAELASETSGPGVDTRLAHLAELEGDLDEAISLMRAAEQTVTAQGRSPETLAWFRTQLGNMLLDNGDVEGAQASYNGALAAFPEYVFALGGLAQSEVGLGNIEDAIALYERALAARAEPPYEAALADIYAARGDEREAAAHEESAIRLAELETENGIPHVAELALLYADAGMNLDRAVEMMLREIEGRQDIYTLDAAAWALHAAGRSEEAAPLIERALALGTQDAQLRYHAGMIRLAVGDRAGAERHLERALELDPVFSLTQAASAREVLGAS